MPHPNPWTADELAGFTGRPAADFADLLAGIDQGALFDAERERLVAAVWDQSSPVNGVPAADVLASANVPNGGAVVTVGGHDGSTMILQPFDPERPGMLPIDPAGAQDLADRLADRIAADRARSAAAERFPAGTLTPGTPAPTPTPDYVTRDEFDMLMTMVLEG